MEIGGVKIFLTNLDCLLGLGYPGNLSQIRHNWIFGWFEQGFAPHFVKKMGFGLGGGEDKNVTPNIILWLSWAYPVNFVWFWSVEVEIISADLPLFAKKLGFGLEGGENFHPKSHSFIILGFSLKILFDCVQ